MSCGDRPSFAYSIYRNPYEPAETNAVMLDALGYREERPTSSSGGLLGGLLFVIVIGLIVWLVVLLMKPKDGSCKSDVKGSDGKYTRANRTQASPLIELSSYADFAKMCKSGACALFIVSPQCHHCKKAKPEMEKTAKSCSVPCYILDASMEFAMQICKELGVTGVPSYHAKPHDSKQVSKIAPKSRNHHDVKHAIEKHVKKGAAMEEGDLVINNGNLEAAER